ncbi:MAG: SUMF1/EgtB/PvdO family nonheme iron enzyme, partial [Dolichospermum sp.]
MLDMNITLEPPQKYNADISQKVNDAILKGMELDYQKRPQSIEEWFMLLGIKEKNQSLPISQNPIDNHLKIFHFETVTTNAYGKIINKRNHAARYFTEDLGNGVMLEMVEIPSGTFYMGSPENETGRTNSEGPRHQVTVKSFFIAKYPLTQAQYQ